MLDRILKLIVTLTLLLFLIQAVIGALARVLEAALRGFFGSLGTDGGFLGQAVMALAVACFAIGLVVHALRISLSGTPTGFGLYDIMAFLGKQQCISRIDRALTACGSPSR